MAIRNLHFLKKYPLFLLLLPVFFVLHGLIENYNSSLVIDALELAAIYTGVSILLAAVCWLFFRDINKASIVAFALMAFNVFFGSIHDFLKKIARDSFIVKYSFIIPGVLIVFIVLIIFFKRTKRSFSSIIMYLNVFFLVVIVTDSILLFFTIKKRPKNIVANLTAVFRDCDSCSRPDVFIIIADEYPGKMELNTIFSFDNSAFESELQQRGFHIVPNSVSNYNPTYYSLASMLSMDYIHHSWMGMVNHRDMLICGNLINDNNLVRFFRKNGYSFFNQSFFEVASKKNAVANPFYSSKKKLISSQTFTNRLRKEMGFNFTRPQWPKFDNSIDSLTRKIAESKSVSSKFVFSHLNMPHHPYFFDRNGNKTPPDHLVDSYKLNKPAFIEYLLYTNKRLLELIDHIKNTAQSPPVIILTSDHGFRQFTDSIFNKFHFINLNAVLLPNADYSVFYDGMSNVNLFRVVLNSQFGQQLPLLKDSTIFLRE